MSTYECPVCGRKYKVEDYCCGEMMTGEDNVLRCGICGNKVEIPSCHGKVMVRLEE
jgi:transcription elongation factor Elf1